VVKNAHIRFTTNAPAIHQFGISVQFIGDERHLGQLAEFAGSCPEEKIISAFLRQGTKIFRELAHDFLLVLQSTDCTYLVRDRFGVQSLYFKRVGDALQFSTDVRELRTDEVISSRQVWDYFYTSTSQEPEVSNTTFFEGIEQVPPSHYYYLQRDGHCGFVPYYFPDPDQGVREPASAFRDRLYASVQRCTEKAGICGAHLSGGLDSSSVALMYAKRLAAPFSTFYFDIGETSQRDPYYAHLVSEKIDSIHHYVPADVAPVFEETLLSSSRNGFPEMFVLPSSVHSEIARYARAQGVDTLLTGMDGDSVVGHGYAYLGHLRDRSEWELLVNEIANIRMRRQGILGASEAKVRKNVVAEELKALLKYGESKRFASLFSLARKRWGYTPFHFVSFLAKEWTKRRKYPTLLKMSEPLPVSPGFDSLYSYSDEEILNNFRAVVNADYPYYFEQFRHIGEAEGVKFEHPFFDQSLFELCLSIPDKIRFGGGETRSLLRKAMAELLPPELLQRQDKDEFSPFLYRSCLYLWTAHQDYFHAHPTLWDWVDLRSFLKQMQILRSFSPYDPRSRMLARNLSKVLYFGCWLSSYD
jgi:asparagine synthase (glutamine-hydrolysing)